MTSRMSRDRALDAAAAILAGAPGRDDPDADLIRLCARHVANRRAYEAGALNVVDETQDPLWRA